MGVWSSLSDEFFVYGVFRTKSIMALHINSNLYIARKETEWEVRIWGQSERIYPVRKHVAVYGPEYSIRLLPLPAGKI